MKALILTDSDYNTKNCQTLYSQIVRIFADQGYDSERRELTRQLNSCMGCFGCWIRKPGECVIPDEMSELNRLYTNSDAVIFLSPVIFGQFSANIKNALDRTLPSVLPFFNTRKDGSTMHPMRYKKNPKLFVIGYGLAVLPEEESQLFRDITLKHRFNANLEI